MKRHHLDWSSYETAGQGDAYAGIPATGGDFAKAVAVCINDKLCQRTPKGVMCPSFRVTGDAAHSPGGRVMVLKAALNGELGDDPFSDPGLAEVMELCVGCKGCKRECANQVDMAAIKIEYQAQNNERRGISHRDWLGGRIAELVTPSPSAAQFDPFSQSYAVVGKTGGIHIWDFCKTPVTGTLSCSIHCAIY